MESLRLVKTYRGYKSGEVIQATPGLAEALRRDGIAVTETRASLLPPVRERAIETRATLEERRS